MKKTLIIFIVILGSYLLFDKFTKEDESIEVTVATVSTDNVASKEKPAQQYEVEASDILETKEIGSEFIEGVYAATLDDENIKANLRFSFSNDGTFSDYRDMSYPKSVAGETSGTYVVDGALIILTYPEIRDTEVFKFSESTMTLHKDGTLKTGVVVLTKQ
jgi:hypothetical protein